MNEYSGLIQPGRFARLIEPASIMIPSWRKDEEAAFAGDRFRIGFTPWAGFGDPAGCRCTESRGFFFGYPERCRGRLGFSPEKSSPSRELPFFPGSSAGDQVGPHQLPAGEKCRPPVEQR